MKYTLIEKRIKENIEKSPYYKDYPVDINFILRIRRRALNLMENGIDQEERNKAVRIFVELFFKVAKYLNRDSTKENTLNAIGLWLGVTRERVRQLEAQALKKLKHPKTGKSLKNYVEDLYSSEKYGEPTLEFL